MGKMKKKSRGYRQAYKREQAIGKVTLLTNGLLRGCIESMRNLSLAAKHFRAVSHQATIHMLRELEDRFPDIKPLFIPILSAGLCFNYEVMQTDAPVGYIGMSRNEKTLKPCRHYLKLPKAILPHLTPVLCEPMAATGGSLIAAIRILFARGAKRVIILNFFSAPDAVVRINKEFGDRVVFMTAALEPGINSKGFIMDGVGRKRKMSCADFGDRYRNEEEMLKAA